MHHLRQTFYQVILLIITKGNSVVSFLLQWFQCQLWHAHTPRLTGSLRHWITWKNVVKVEFHQECSECRSIFELLTLSTHINYIISITSGEVGWAENHVEILCCADSLLFQLTVGHPTAPCHLPLWNLSQPARRQSSKETSKILFGVCLSSFL